MKRMITHFLLSLWLVAGASGCDMPRTGAAASEQAIEQDPVLRAATDTIASGHPWQATLMLQPLLNDSARRVPAVVLVAARAAAGWDGWEQVERLLAGAPWVDTLFAGEGRELLARSALQRGDDSAATVNAAAAIRTASDEHQRALRLTLMARALDRADSRDSARVAYEAAASELAPIRQWLLLRAAGVTNDSAARTRYYADVSRDVARARIPWTEAQTLERTGNRRAAAERYAALGADARAFRLRYTLASGTAERTRMKNEILAFVKKNSGTSRARDAVQVLDEFTRGQLTGSEELIVARSAAASGPASRAIDAFSESPTRSITSSDRLTYGKLLANAGRYTSAIAQFNKIRSGSLAGDAAYQRARALLNSGNGSSARSALRSVASRFASDETAATSALYLLADLTTDDGDDAGARTLFRRLTLRYPSSSRADLARFRAALIAYVAGDYKRTVTELDWLVENRKGSAEAMSARYWAGRAYAQLGDSAAARERWRDIMAQEPMSYYAMLSATRLGAPQWSAPATTDTFPAVPQVDSIMARIALLSRLGMTTEAEFEADALEANADQSVARTVATARAFLDAGQASRTIRLGWKAINRGARSADIYRLVYPVVDPAVLSQMARDRSLEPSFVAAVIRQESNFYPRAVSGANARGLMQVLPSVGESVARTLNYPVWDTSLLFEPDVNLQIGTAHLAEALRQYRSPVRALAAYNAGGSRVDRWSDKPGMDDPEIFTERIPYVETRDYVRIVTRNAQVYGALYPGDRW